MRVARRRVVQQTATMRPSVLDPLFAAITALPGIGDKVARLYRRLLGREDTPRVVDLLLHLPTGAVDRRARPVRGRCCGTSCPVASSPSR
jgi:ATP-dependent DNA helicase RecG